MTDLIDTSRLEKLIRHIVRDEIGDTNMTPMQPGQLLTPKQVAQLWGCHERTVTRQLLAGSLPGVRVGRNWRVRADDAAR